MTLPQPLKKAPRFCFTDYGMKEDADGAWMHLHDLATIWPTELCTCTKDQLCDLHADKPDHLRVMQALQAADAYIEDLEAHEGAEGWSDSTRELGRLYMQAKRRMSAPPTKFDLSDDAVNRILEGVMGSILGAVAQEVTQQELRQAVLEEVLAVAEQALEEYSTAEHVIGAIRRLKQPQEQTDAE